MVTLTARGSHLSLAKINHWTVIIKPTTFNSMDANPCKASLMLGWGCMCTFVMGNRPGTARGLIDSIA